MVKQLLKPLALAVPLALAGCGLGPGQAPKGVSLTVTRDFGAKAVHASAHPKTAGAETVLSLLARNYPVGTRYGGGFVQSIDGLSGSQSLDWFYYVNGVEADKGAAATNVQPGERIWWDLHDWSETDSVPAVVGSFPEPFLDGYEGKRLPVRVECSRAQGRACRTVAGRLQAAGVPAAISAIGAGASSETLRILVGPWHAVSIETVAEQLRKGPRTSGVYAIPAAGGESIALLDEDGRAVKRLSGDAGLIAAVRQGQTAPVWLVTGTDETGAEMAAQDFDEAALRDRFALAVTHAGALALPREGR
jgi:hypothetical protein